MSRLKLRIFDKNGTEIVHGFNKSSKLEEGNFYMKKVSVGLFETDTLIFLNDDNGTLVPITTALNGFRLNSSKLDNTDEVLVGDQNFRLNYSELNSTSHLLGNVSTGGNTNTTKGLKILLFIDTETQEDLRFFTVDDSGEITWTNKILVKGDLTEDIGVHIAFMGSKEGVYENKIYICETITAAQNPDDILEDEEITPIATINVHSYAIGEDERYRHMFTNFGIPDPKTYLDIFKDEETLEDTESKAQEQLYQEKNNPNYHKYDDNIDYDFLNKESKKLFLTYPEIFPYVGTYKALINAIDYLGYTDIYFKEWFKELPSTPEMPAKKVSYEISYKNPHSILTALPLERKMSLKKLNWLSMIYKISEYSLDNGGNQKYEYLDDNVQIPITKSNYAAYNADEILIKLIGLKNWLEKYIIGLNCRIIEINGEGICVERYKHRIYGKTTVGSLYHRELSVTPVVMNETKDLELIDSSCLLKLSLRELYEDENFKEKYKSIIFRANLTTKNGIIPVINENRGFTDIPIIIKDGEICFDSNNLNGFRGMESNFKKLPIIQIERANLRDTEKQWSTSKNNDKYHSVIYRIEPNAEKDGYVITHWNEKTETYTTVQYDSYITLYPKNESILKYSANNNFNIPLFMIQSYSGYGDDDTTEYILEILDGKLLFNDDIVDIKNESAQYKENKTFSLNFNFDDDNSEQNIEVNYSYSKEVNINDIPDFKNITENTYLTDMKVNNAGDYRITCVATDKYNNFYANNIFSPVSVYIKDPDIQSITTSKNANNKDDFFDVSPDGKIYDSSVYDDYLHDNASCKAPENYLINNISVEPKDAGEFVIKYASYPTLSYAMDTPKNGDVAHFMNISDNFKYVGHVAYNLNDDNFIIDESNSCENPEDLPKMAIDKDKLKNYGLTPNAVQYTILWLDRNDTFHANCFSTALPGDESYKNNERKEVFSKVNLVIYDKINGRPIFQESCKMFRLDGSKTRYYVVSKTDFTTNIYVYYREELESGDFEVQLAKDEAKSDIVIKEDVVIDSGVEEPKPKTINDILSNKGYLQFFVQSAAEMELESTTERPDHSYVTTKIVAPKLSEDTQEVFKQGDKLKIMYSKKLKNGTNTINYGAAYNCYSASTYEESGEIRIKFTFLNAKVGSDSPVLSRANCAFVDYNFIVDRAQENSDGTTSLYVKDDYNLNFVDRTFSISVRDFDMDNIRKYWSVENDTDKTYYIYQNTPVTLTTDNGKIIISLDETYKDFNTKITHTLWELYKFDKYKNKNDLLLKSWNSALCLNIPDQGIYSVKLSLFDEYGNFVEKTYEGILKITD